MSVSDVEKNKQGCISVQRRSTRTVQIGDVSIGGKAPVSVQSMTNTKTEDVGATVHQIKKLEDAGCEIIRVSVPTPVAAENLGKIKKQIRIPLIADVHFNYRLALIAVQNGADKIRINPGNIGSRKRVESILREAREREIPVRIGVNAGSLEKRIIKNYGGITAEGLVESALNHLMICEDMGFQNIVVSIKASHVPLMIAANRLLSEKTPYPIHLGVTEAGSVTTGVLRSAVGIGALLSEGIGDTIRISLTGDPVEEVKAGYEILKTLHLRKRGLTIISCPTCGRTEINVVSIVEKIEKALGNSDLPITIAVMGCAVNGPGEAREADIGVACGKHDALLFRKGEVIRKIKEEEIVPVLVDEVDQWSE